MDQHASLSAIPANLPVGLKHPGLVIASFAISLLGALALNMMARTLS